MSYHVSIELDEKKNWNEMVGIWEHSQIKLFAPTNALRVDSYEVLGLVRLQFQAVLLHSTYGVLKLQIQMFQQRKIERERERTSEEKSAKYTYSIYNSETKSIVSRESTLFPRCISWTEQYTE